MDLLKGAIAQPEAYREKSSEITITSEQATICSEWRGDLYSNPCNGSNCS
jgi:hypothetical protein